MFLFKAVSGYGLAVIVIVLVIVNIRLNLFTFSLFHLLLFSPQSRRKGGAKTESRKGNFPLHPFPARVKKFQISFSEEDQQYLNSIFERRSAGQEFVDYYG